MTGASSTYAKGEPRQMGLLDHALEYARRGFLVFPCDPDPRSSNAKQPLIARDKDASGDPIPRTGGFYKATGDEATIRKWWTRYPYALIGLRMGRDAKVFAIDPDRPKKSGDPDGMDAWADLTAAHGTPLTHTHVTPRGGRHLLFVYPDHLNITNSSG